MERGLSIGNRHSYLSAQPSQRTALLLGYAVCSQRFGLSVLEGCRHPLRSVQVTERATVISGQDGAWLPIRDHVLSCLVKVSPAIPPGVRSKEWI